MEKDENVTHIQERNQSTETDKEMKWMVELAESIFKSH